MWYVHHISISRSSLIHLWSPSLEFITVTSKSFCAQHTFNISCDNCPSKQGYRVQTPNAYISVVKRWFICFRSPSPLKPVIRFLWNWCGNISENWPFQHNIRSFWVGWCVTKLCVNIYTICTLSDIHAEYIFRVHHQIMMKLIWNYQFKTTFQTEKISQIHC